MVRISRQQQRMKLYEFIQRTLRGKFVHYFVLFCIFLSIMAIISSSFAEMKPYRVPLFGITYLSSFVFLLEYVLRIVSAPVRNTEISATKSRLKYVFSFYGFVDFVAVLPFLLVYLYWNTSVIQAIILPYIFIIFKLIRYSQSFRLIGHVLAAVKEELITAYTACGIMVCFSAILMYYIEQSAQPDAFRNIGDGLWWAVVAFTTVGYGDIYPITPLGKILSSIISMIGIAMIAIPTGLISSSFMSMMQKKNKDKGEKEKVEKEQ